MTKYPIILVHGIAAKQTKHLRAFGRIENELISAGYNAYVADIDGFGAIETNAEQLKKYILDICEKCGADKVNIIAHSKGGLDSKYMITSLGMEDRVASLTTLCTPHRGSVIASWIWKLPRWMKKITAFQLDLFYKLLGDKQPNSMRACEQLRKCDDSEDTLRFSYKVYCQSYSTTLKRGKDCFILGIPMMIYRHFEKLDNDGMVSVESAKFENYRGDCLDISVSHTQMVDILASKKQRERIYEFYRGLCLELSEMGF